MRMLPIVALCVTVWDAAWGCSIPLQPTRTSFVTTVHIGSAGPFRFLVDTGATMTVIDRSVAERIGLKAERSRIAASTTGTIDVLEGIIDELRAGDVSITQTRVLIVALPEFDSHGHLDGILGISFFAGRGVLFDLPNRCIDLDAATPRGVKLDAHEVVGRVAIEIEGLNFILDSGASFPVLMTPGARALASEEGAVELTSISGRQRMTSATIRVLRIGRRTFRDVGVAFAPDRDPREDGLLPITLFARLYLSPDRRFIVLD